MNKYFILFCIIVLLFPIAYCANYNLYTPDNYNPSTITQSERLLFILDYSNSMNENLFGNTKVDVMVKTMKNILPQIDKNIWMGLRVYGHRLGLTPLDACKASTLISPISTNNSFNINNSLSKIHPRGLTPITYSLKQAIKNDFMGFPGKKHIILLTDGGENCDESPCTYVMNLIKIRRDIKIDVIAFNVNDEDDLTQLRCTATVTSGKFYNPQTSAELLNSFNNSIQETKSVEAKILRH